MRTPYQVLVLSTQRLDAVEASLDGSYQIHYADSETHALAGVVEFQCSLLIIDIASLGGEQSISMCRSLKDNDTCKEVSIILIGNGASLDSRLAAYEAGCDDYVADADMGELKHRLERVLFNKLANAQLKVQLQQANEMAFIATSDTSDLGVNVQFLLDVNQCNNLDELGMRLFQALNNYGLNCSLQMRSRYAVKNMEANGMAKELESALLMECREQGRYVDFGKRSIMNYGDVSLLVKNMPVNDPKKYGAIKDNVFSLLQGAHARIEALDNLYSLEIESQVVKRLVESMRTLMGNVDESYQDVMKDIANVVETMAAGVENSLQFLGMDEFQEKAIQDIMETGIAETTRVFNEGVRIDNGLAQLLDRVEGIMAAPQANADELKHLLTLLSKASVK